MLKRTIIIISIIYVILSTAVISNAEGIFGINDNTNRHPTFTNLEELIKYGRNKDILKHDITYTNGEIGNFYIFNLTQPHTVVAVFARALALDDGEFAMQIAPATGRNTETELNTALDRFYNVKECGIIVTSNPQGKINGYIFPFPLGRKNNDDDCVYIPEFDRYGRIKSYGYIPYGDWYRTIRDLKDPGYDDIIYIKDNLVLKN